MNKTIALLSTLVRHTCSVPYKNTMNTKTPPTLGYIVKALKWYLKPSVFAEKWDNVGLLVESSRKDEKLVKKILICNDLTLPVMEEAIQKSIDLIIAYHPPIFQAFKSLTFDNWKQEILIQCITNGISIYSPHTALDAIPGGINDAFVELFDNPEPGEFNQLLEKVEAFNPIGKEKHDGSLLGATFVTSTVPHEVGNICKNLIASENEDFCFKFEKNYGYLGKPRNNTTTDYAVTLTGICINPSLKGTAAEFPGIVMEAFPSFTGVKYPDPSIWLVPGSGRIIHLKSPLKLKEVVYHVQMGLDLKDSHVSDAGSPISTIAVCVGSGGSFFGGKRVADLIITGEMSHHQILDCTQQGMSLILLGHCNSERHYLRMFASTLGFIIGGKDTAVPEIIVSTADITPLKISWCSERADFPAVFSL